MDPYSSGEELVIKIRKPYTITKQRERWTEEEHSRFLEALKLYGRAWQRIEEHIGTKTAVQIRSHAQKFFTKLEKEALVKGLPVGQAIDIEIPPPRPKRKPTNPYPRKTSVGTPTSQAGTKDEKPLTSECSLHAGKHVLDLEKEPSPEKQSGVDPFEIGKENREGVNCSETFSFFKETPSGPLSSANESLMSLKASDSRCTFKELVPILKEVVNEDATNESYVTVEPSGSWNIKKLDSQQTLFKESHTCNPSKVGNSHSSHGKLCAILSNDIEAVLNYPRHVPVHVVDGTRSRNVSPDISYEGGCLFHQMGQVNEQPNLFGNVATASTTEHPSDVSRSAAIRQAIPPFTPMHSNLDDCQSFVHTPSTFSSLVASALLQNPAAHAAASFAATFWPFSANMETCPARQINSAPSLAAVAAATVAAATAWWAAHGLLPLCTTPFNTGYTCSPIARPMGSGAAGVTNSNTPDPALKDQKLGPKYTKASEEQPMLASSKSLLLSSSSSDSAEVEDGKLDPEKAEPVTELHDSSKMKVRKPVDRSSCGSNTPSSSEVETDALEKHDDKGKEEPNEHDDVSNVASDPSSNRRGRICSNPNNESWKEVSEGGRLAFQALFSREVLPQSFSPPNDHQNNNSDKQQHTSEKEEKASVFDLNSEACGAYSSNQLVEKNNERFGYVKFKGPRRTGFKPYKRCSVEAKESRVAAKQDEIKAPKRMRLEGGPSGC